MSNLSSISQVQQLQTIGYEAKAVHNLLKPVNGKITSLEDIHNIIHSLQHCRIEDAINNTNTISKSVIQGSVFCLEAALIASDLISLLNLSGRLMIVTRLDPKNNTHLGHTALIYRATNSLFAAIAMSRYQILNDRPAEFTAEEDVILSYAEAYVTLGYKPICFGLADIDTVSDGLDWRRDPIAMAQLQERLLDTQINSFDISYSN